MQDHLDLNPFRHELVDWLSFCRVWKHWLRWHRLEGLQQMQIAPLKIFIFWKINAFVGVVVVDIDILQEITETLRWQLEDCYLPGSPADQFLLAIVPLSLCVVWCETRWAEGAPLAGLLLVQPAMLLAVYAVGSCSA